MQMIHAEFKLKQLHLCQSLWFGIRGQIFKYNNHVDIIDNLFHVTNIISTTKIFY